jgi:hypothetical protein
MNVKTHAKSRGRAAVKTRVATVSPPSLKVKTDVKAGALDDSDYSGQQHNETLLRGGTTKRVAKAKIRGLKVKTNVKAGSMDDNYASQQHNETLLSEGATPDFNVKADIKAGTTSDNQNKRLVGATGMTRRTNVKIPYPRVKTDVRAGLADNDYVSTQHDETMVRAAGKGRSQRSRATGLKVQTKVRAGMRCGNHNETLARASAKPKARKDEDSRSTLETNVEGRLSLRTTTRLSEA